MNSPRQTFVAFPIAILLFDLLRSKPRVHRSGIPFLVAGYALYRLAGYHRQEVRHAGPRGSAEPPLTLVTDGPYAVSRNPMYLGHLVFMLGLVIGTRSPVAVALALRQARRFTERVRVDEKRLDQIFGAEYRRYRERVPRWLAVRQRAPRA